MPKEQKTDENTSPHYDEARELLLSVRDECALYASSGDPTLARVGRINGTIAGALLALMSGVDPARYDEAHAQLPELPVYSEPEAA